MPNEGHPTADPAHGGPPQRQPSRPDPTTPDPAAPERHARRALDDDEVTPSVQYGEDPGVP